MPNTNLSQGQELPADIKFNLNKAYAFLYKIRDKHPEYELLTEDLAKMVANLRKKGYKVDVPTEIRLPQVSDEVELPERISVQKVEVKDPTREIDKSISLVQRFNDSPFYRMKIGNKFIGTPRVEFSLAGNQPFVKMTPKQEDSIPVRLVKPDGGPGFQIVQVMERTEAYKGDPGSLGQYGDLYFMNEGRSRYTYLGHENYVNPNRHPEWFKGSYFEFKTGTRYDNKSITNPKVEESYYLYNEFWRGWLAVIDGDGLTITQNPNDAMRITFTWTEEKKAVVEAGFIEGIRRKQIEKYKTWNSDTTWQQMLTDLTLPAAGGLLTEALNLILNFVIDVLMLLLEMIKALLKLLFDAIAPSSLTLFIAGAVAGYLILKR